MSRKSCVFCEIVAGKAPATIVHREEQVVAFRDVRPMAPTHILIVPVRHIESLGDIGLEDEALLGRLFAVARDLAVRESVDRSGYRLVLNTGPEAGQSVYHIHVHLLGGRQMHWPPG